MSLAMDEMTIEELTRLYVLGFVAIIGNGHLAAVVESNKADDYEQERCKHGY